MKHIKKIFVGFLILFLSYVGVSWYFSNQLIFFKSRTLEEDIPRYKINSHIQLNLNAPEEIEIKNADITLKGWYFAGKNQCGVIFHHGYGGTRIGIMKYIPLFKEFNCHMILYDARHHGNSTRKSGTFGYYEKFDLEKVIDFLKEKAKIPDENIVLVGESMGAATIIQFAGYTERNFKMILADSPYKDLESIVKKRSKDLYGKFALIFLKGAFLISELRSGINIEEISPVKFAASIQTPILIIHSRNDDYTPSEHSVEIFNALKLKEKEVILTDWGSEHAKSIDDNYDKYNFYLKEFIKKYNIIF